MTDEPPQTARSTAAPTGGARGLAAHTRTAVGTVVIALVLFAAKLAAAIASESIGLVSTAIDSGLDLLLSFTVLAAVIMARRPADPEHPYGHGKFENVAGLIEAGVLAATGIIVGTYAMERLLDPQPIVLSDWMVAVMVLAMVVAAERTYSLRRAAREHRSPVFKVDAWHFASDLVGTAIVLAGILLAARGHLWADGASALAVAAILIVGSLHVAWDAVGDLVDRAPPELLDRVRDAIMDVPHVEGTPQVRMRGSGPDLFVDATVEVSRALGMERAHEVMDHVERAVRVEVGDADIVVHAEPVRAAESVQTTLKVLAARTPRILGIHEIFVDELEDGRTVVDCHVEVDEDLTLREAHAIAQDFEAQAKAHIGPVAGIRTHIEPMPREHRTAKDVTGVHDDIVERIERAVVNRPFTGECDIVIKQVDGQLEAIVTACMDGVLALGEAHEAAEELERRLLAMLPVLSRVVVHVEPA